MYKYIPVNYDESLVSLACSVLKHFGAPYTHCTLEEFDKLLEIVESDIYLVQQNSTLENPKEKFLNIDLEKLYELKVAIEEYMSFLEVPDNSDDWMYD